jgi:hypothetical protein
MISSILGLCDLERVPLSTRVAGGEGRVRGVFPQTPLYPSHGTALTPTLSRCAGEGDAQITRSAVQS